MIGWTVLGFFLLVALLLAARVLVNADPKALAKGLRYGAAGFFGLIAAFFAVTGRLAVAGPFAVLATLCLGAGGRTPFSGFPGFSGRKSSPGQQSEITTRYLHMVLDHDSGEMTGIVLEGPQKGVDLTTLNFIQLVEIYELLETEDGEGATLLAAYMERMHAAKWADSHAGGASGSGANAGGSAAGPDNAMTPDEARKILGLSTRATAAEIKAAHKKLMKKMHPDQGGSTYLASKINRAKEILLEIMNRGASG